MTYSNITIHTPLVPLWELETAQREIGRLRATLETIAKSDYRGNRLTCQIWAREALNKCPEGALE